MKRIFYFIILFSFASQASSQTKTNPVSELQQILFISEVHGMTAMTRNPAGLSIVPDDDGVFFNYNFFDLWERGERNFSITMSNLAFAFQEFELENDVPTATLRRYKLGVSVGGKVFSLGTSNNIIEYQSPDRTKRVFDVDVGLIFQPMNGIGLAVFARHVTEPTVGDYHFKREYIAGIGLRLLDQRFKILAETVLTDNTRYIEDARLKAGLSLVPVRNLEIMVGGIIAEGDDEIYLRNEQFFATVQIPFLAIRFMAATRINEKGQFLRYSAALFIPLKTIKF